MAWTARKHATQAASIQSLSFQTTHNPIGQYRHEVHNTNKSPESRPLHSSSHSSPSIAEQSTASHPPLHNNPPLHRPPLPRRPTHPIPVPSGLRIIETILNGTVTGPSLNGTITQRLAKPLVISNQSVQVPSIELYGETDDGVPFPPAGRGDWKSKCASDEGRKSSRPVLTGGY